MSQALRLLMVEDSEDDATLLLRELRRAGYAVTWERVDTAAAMRAALERQPWDVVTSDHAMPKFSAPAALAILKELGPGLPFIIVSNEINLNLAVSLMKAGAQDYIQKRELAKVGPAIQRELREVDMRRERQRAEAAQRESEYKYRGVFETVADALLVVDQATGAILDVNESACRLYGYAREAMLKLKFADLSDEPEEVAQAGATKRAWSAFHLHRKQNGTSFPVGLTASDSERRGRPISVMAIRDMTETVEAETALRESEQKYRDLAESLPLIVYEMDLQGNLTFANHAAFETFGYEPGEFEQGTNVLNFMVPEDRERARQNLQQPWDRPSEPSTYTLRRRDGSNFLVQVYRTPLVRDGQLIGFRGAILDLTERRQAEATLRRSEELFQSYFELSSIGGAILSPEKGWLAVNPKLCDLLGYTREELLQSTWAQLTPPDEQAAEAARLERLLSGTIDSTAFEKHFLRKDATRVKVQISPQCVRKADGSVDYLVLAVQNFTARTAPDVELEEQMRAERLLAGLSTAFFNLTVDAVEGEIVRGLQQVVEWLGVERGSLLEFSPGEAGFQIRYNYEVPGLELSSLVPPLFTAHEYPEYIGRLREGRPVISERLADLPLDAAPERDLGARIHLKSHVAAPLKAGSAVWGAIALSNFTRERAWPPEIITHLRLIGEVFVNALIRKKAEEETRQRNRELETIGQLIGTISANLNLQEILNHALSGALQLTNLEGGTLCLVKPGSQTLILSAWQNASAHMVAELGARDVRLDDCLCEEAASTGSPLVVWDHASTNDYTTREILRDEGLRFHAAFPLNVKGRTIGLLCLFARSSLRPTQRQLELVQQLCGPIALAIDNAQLYEQTQWHAAELEQRVTKRTQELAAINQELEAFSYSVAHDLRAPLRTIDGFSQVLLEDFGELLGPDGERHLQRIRTASERMSRLIDDLLELSRLTRGDLDRTLFDMSALAQIIADELQQRAPDQPVQVRIARGIMVRADAALLRAALENLLGNAWKFTSKTAQPLIEVGTYVEQRDGQEERIYFVRDNGAGFDMAQVDQLFKAFQRLHAADEFPGTGIGLATVRRIIHRHGGRVWAEGAAGRGAVFYFTL